MKYRQSGLSILGFIFVLIPIIAMAFIVMRAVPVYHEYFSIKKVLKATVDEVGSSATKSQLATAFERRAQIDDITSIRGNDLRISREGANTVVSAEYEKRITLLDTASMGKIGLSFDFTARAEGR
jgi:high-affinity Fe2+/Pb2+ permease